MNLRQVNNEVFVAEGPIARVGPNDVAFLKQQAFRNARQRARICAHQDTANLLHEMIIAITRASYIRPHRHLGRSESFHVIEGVVDVVIYDDEGRMIDVIELGDLASGRQFYYRLENERFHGLVVQSEVLVFHEVTNGPFAPDLSQLAPFAPEERDEVAMRRFATVAREDAQRFLAAQTGAQRS